MNFAGIDYSMTSPALCIGKRGAKSKDCSFIAFQSGKKVGVYGNLRVLEYPLWSNEQERFDKLSQMVLEVLIEEDVSSAYIEGYAFGGKGKVFNLAENTGLLKHKLWLNRFPFAVIAPTTVKKFQTGKGNQKKEQMYEAWLADGGEDINGLFTKSTKIGSPQNDVVDAYFIWKCGLASQ